MAEPAADHVDLDAGLEQVDGGGVAERCAGRSAGRFVGRRGGGVAADDLVDAEAGQRLAARGEDRAVVGGGERVSDSSSCVERCRRSAARAGRSAICRPCRAGARSGARRGRGARRAGRRLLARGRRCCRGTGSARGRAARGGPVLGSLARSCWTSSRSRNRVSGGGTRLVGIAATCWQTAASPGSGSRCTRTGCGSRPGAGCGCGCGCRGPTSR